MTDASDTPPFGERMQALNERQRRFVIELFNAPRATGRLTWAAQAAGFGAADGSSSKRTIAVIASRLNSDPKIQVAIAEEAQRRLRSLAPSALRSLEKLVDDPKAKDHARGIAMVLDRADPVETKHVLQVEHAPPSTEAIEQTLRRIEEIARRVGVKLPPPTIDAEAIEVAP